MFHSYLHVCICYFVFCKPCTFQEHFSPCKHCPAFSPPKQNRASPLKEVNNLCFWGSRVHQPESATVGFQVDKWNLEALSEATLTRVAGSAMTVHMTLWKNAWQVGWKTRWMVLKWLRGRWGSCLKFSIRIRGLECFFLRSAEKYHFG